MSANNPYHSASSAYSDTSVATDQRLLESRVLLKAAAKLDTLANRLEAGETPTLAEIDEVLDYNRKLWLLFVSETMNDDHALPQEIKNNIASLGVFVFKRTIDILADTRHEKIRALVDINRNIASGLAKAAANAAAAEAKAEAAERKPTDNMA